MRAFIFLSVLLSSLSVFSQEDFAYTCIYPDDHSYKIEIVVSEEKMLLLDQYYNGAEGDVLYKNYGLMGGKGKMKDRLYFAVDEASEIFPPEGFEHFYLSPELTSGGFQLRNGSKGGFITFNGHGYSYETFICFLKKNKK